MAIEAAPPGVPDDVDLDRLKDYIPPDMVAFQQRQLVVAFPYKVAAFLWGGCVLMSLTLFVFTGSFLFGLLGYGVTVPFVLVCYRYRQPIDAYRELHDFCERIC